MQNASISKQTDPFIPAVFLCIFLIFLFILKCYFTDNKVDYCFQTYQYGNYYLVGHVPWHENRVLAQSITLDGVLAAAGKLQCKPE